jgi:hypothetical protein
MERLTARVFVTLALISMLFASSTCEDRIAGEDGVLEGKISIGPLCPVETDPPQPGCLPTAETYKEYPVGIWTTDGNRKVARISPAQDGSFSLLLVPGQYLVKLDISTVIGGSNLPMIIEVNTLEKTTVKIDIDTGIR